jgi:hypothetical protein
MLASAKASPSELRIGGEPRAAIVTYWVVAGVGAVGLVIGIAAVVLLFMPLCKRRSRRAASAAAAPIHPE